MCQHVHCFVFPCINRGTDHGMIIGTCQCGATQTGAATYEGYCEHRNMFRTHYPGSPPKSERETFLDYVKPSRSKRAALPGKSKAFK